MRDRVYSSLINKPDFMTRLLQVINYLDNNNNHFYKAINNNSNNKYLSFDYIV